MCLFKPFIKLLSGAVRAKPVLVHVWTETSLVAQVWKEVNFSFRKSKRYETVEFFTSFLRSDCIRWGTGAAASHFVRGSDSESVVSVRFQMR